MRAHGQDRFSPLHDGHQVSITGFHDILHTLGMRRRSLDRSTYNGTNNRTPYRTKRIGAATATN